VDLQLGDLSAETPTCYCEYSLPILTPESIMSTQQPDSELGISPDAPVLGQVEELPRTRIPQ